MPPAGATNGHGQVGLALVNVLRHHEAQKGGEAGLKAYCAEKGLTFPQTIDDAIPEAYGDVLEIPVTVLIDAHGKIRYRWHGERDYASFARTIERLQSER